MREKQPSKSNRKRGLIVNIPKRAIKTTNMDGRLVTTIFQEGKIKTYVNCQPE